MWSVVGQEKAVALLGRCLVRGRFPHAWLFVGPSHVGKMTLASDVARVLNCTGDRPPCGECPACLRIAAGKHADVQVLNLETASVLEGKQLAEIGVGQVRALQHAASLPPFEGKHKVFIIDGAETLSVEAANCLLKTLEEPAGQVVFILLTSNESLLPETVVSRCLRTDVLPLPAAKIEATLLGRGVPPERARLLARLARGCLGWALSAGDENLLRHRTEQLDELAGVVAGDTEARFAFAGQLAARFSQNRQLVQDRLDLWLDWWRDLLLVKTGLEEAVTNVDRLEELRRMAPGFRVAQVRAFIDSIQLTGDQLKQNANARLALEVLMLSLPGAAAEAASISSPMSAERSRGVRGGG